MGYTVRDSGWRFTVWKAWEGTTLRPLWFETVAIELYDHREDADGRDFNRWENVNVAADPVHADVIDRLQAAVAAQFRPSV